MNQIVVVCPHCRNEDPNMMEQVGKYRYFCYVCSKTFTVRPNGDDK